MGNEKYLQRGSWKEFDFKELFDFKRGKRLVTLDQIPGNIPYISSSKKNNGVDNYISPPSFMPIYRNCLTLNNSGSVGYCFYHPYEFVCSDHCTAIWIKDESKKLNIYLALFLKPIIESMDYKYNFAREISDQRLKKEKINLPQDKNGKPDWDYMEKTIKEISKSVFFDLPVNKTKELYLDTSSFFEFDLSTLFKVRGSKSSFTQYEINPGKYLFITTTNKNNGVLSTSDIYTEEGGVITIDSATDGKAFYQENKFVGSDHVEVLEPIGFKLDKHMALFFISILNFELYKYGYGRKRAQKRILKEKILLPYKLEGNKKIPDFDAMQNQIKSLNYSKYLN